MHDTQLDSRKNTTRSKPSCFDSNYSYSHEKIPPLHVEHCRIHNSSVQYDSCGRELSEEDKHCEGRDSPNKSTLRAELLDK